MARDGMMVMMNRRYRGGILRIRALMNSMKIRILPVILLRIKSPREWEV